jgi:hypothetical protein
MPARIDVPRGRSPGSLDALGSVAVSRPSGVGSAAARVAGARTASAAAGVARTSIAR